MHKAVLCFTLSCVVGAISAAADTKVLKLRCEYRENPIGIDETVPRFSWNLEAAGRGIVQSAYQILVADSSEALEEAQGNLWDSGKVASPEMILIPYAGKPLTSRQQVCWKVRVWDGADQPSAWSAPAQFSMGLLNRDDWKAAWIGYDAAYDVKEEATWKPDLKGSTWIWFDEGDPVKTLPDNAECRLRSAFSFPDKKIAEARLLASADNEAQLWLNGVQITKEEKVANWQRCFSYNIETVLQPGQNTLAAWAKNATGSAGFTAKIAVRFADESSFEFVSDGRWKAFKGHPGAQWKQADFDDAAWPQAKALVKVGEHPWGLPSGDAMELPPAPYLRRDFSVDKPVRRATVYASALGIYELYFNGQRVGDDYFTPGWTDYRKRVYYNTFDVTGLLQQGKNAAGAILADGWYAGYLGFKGKRNNYGGDPRFCMQLEIEYADGETQVITTDKTWTARYGQILEADLLMGERRDFRIDMRGWNTPECAVAEWQPVSVTDWISIPVEAYPGAPVIQHEILTAQKMDSPKEGVYIYDMGQNMVGWPKITVQGKAGDTVRIRQTEMLEENGMLYTAALRAARATDFYTLADDQPVLLEPGFTFHGYRYVEITGLDTPPAPEAVQGVVLHADIPIAAEFDSSNPLLNRLCLNIRWGQKGNYFEIPTDCPQRDERLGWTGDAQFFMPTALYTAEIGAFFTKWMVDLAQDSQLDDGSFAHVAPDLGLGGGAVAWGDAAIICPWLIYRFYGDTRIIEAHYDNMIKGMDFLTQSSENHIRKNLGFGDWLNLGGGAKDEVICTAYYAYLAELMAEMGEVIGRKDQAAYYRDLHEKVRNAFIEAFVTEDGGILESSQTGYALAFAFDLLPEDKRAAAANHFVKEIERFDWHLATGFIGTPRLLPALCLADRNDIAYRLLMTKTFPSWLYQVTLGSTTMWERWNGWTPEDGFAPASMNSFNHYAFGAVGEWIYSVVAGIQSKAPGFQDIVIDPLPGGGLTHAGMTYTSIRGPISSQWKLEGDRIQLTVTLPPNSSATVYIPTSDPASVQESGKPLDAAAGVTPLKSVDGAAVCQVGSGTYTFEAAAPAMPAE